MTTIECAPPESSAWLVLTVTMIQLDATGSILKLKSACQYSDTSHQKEGTRIISAQKPTVWTLSETDGITAQSPKDQKIVTVLIYQPEIHMSGLGS